MRLHYLCHDEAGSPRVEVREASAHRCEQIAWHSGVDLTPAPVVIHLAITTKFACPQNLCAPPAPQV